MEDRVLAALGITPSDAHYQAKVAGAIAALTTDATTRVTAYLDKIDVIESAINAEREALGGPYAQLKTEGRRQSRLISIALGIAVQEDVW